MNLERRLWGVRRLLRGVDGLLVTDIVNIRYLTGFRGSSGFVLLSRKESIFVTDFRYELQAHQELAGFDIIIEKRNVPQAVKLLAGKTGLRRLGVEESVSFGLSSALQKSRMKARLHSSRKQLGVPRKHFLKSSPSSAPGCGRALSHGGWRSGSGDGE
jgi:Xaa-Pro aminopeptidase